MTSIPNPAEERETKACPTANNSDSIRDAGDKLNGAASGDEDSKTLLFSKELATKINPQRPDITASIIIYGLYLWQKAKVKQFGYVPMVNGHRGSYRSLSDLREEYPWLSEEAIRKALVRAEKALNGWFVVNRNNPEAERGKLHYWISPKLIKKYRFEEKRKGLLEVNAEDVANFGMIEAVLIANLAYVTEATRNSEPLTDDEGRIYRELSPTTLTEERQDLDGVMKSILPCRRNRLTEAIEQLLEKKAMFEHPEKRGYYRLKTASENVSKVASNVSKVASDVSKVAGDVSKVARQNEGMTAKPCIDAGFRSVVKTSDTNTCSNADSNTGSKCILPFTAELRSPVNGLSSNLSAGAKKLMQLTNECLIAFRQKPRALVKHVYEKGQEDIYGPVFDKRIKHMRWYLELPHDFIALDWRTGKLYSRKAEIEEAVAEIKSHIWPKMRSSADVEKLRQLFMKHPLLEAEHIFDLLEDIQPQSGKWGFGPIARPRRGHDDCYWGRRISTLGQFLNYLPQLIKEAGGELIMDCDVKQGIPVYSYAKLPEPYFSLAFNEASKDPITYKYEEDSDGEWAWRPIYYAEFMRQPINEVAQYECNPIADAA